MTKRPPTNVGFGHPVDLEGGHDDTRNSFHPEPIPKGQGVDDGGEHAHMIGGHPIVDQCIASSTPDDIPTSHHQTELYLRPEMSLGQFVCDGIQALRIDPHSSVSTQDLAGYLQDDATIDRINPPRCGIW
jgi:hypothetical protein